MSKIYEPVDLSLEIFKKRYALHENESWSEACERVGSHVASAEYGENVTKYKHIFSNMLKKNEFMPGGRIWYGSGRPKRANVELFCY